MSYYLKPANENKHYIDRIELERQWFINEIARIERTKLLRRPSAATEIQHLKRQIRQRELDLAFNGPEWTKYEKYGMWESLTN